MFNCCLFPPAQRKNKDYYNRTIENIQINSEQIEFAKEAAHVGIDRSTISTMPHLLGRFTAHRRAVNACLLAGLARGHRGNPAAALHLETRYGAPVLFSGVSSLVLTPTEVTALSIHHKEFIQSLVKLYRRTARLCGLPPGWMAACPGPAPPCQILPPGHAGPGPGKHSHQARHHHPHLNHHSKVLVHRPPGHLQHVLPTLSPLPLHQRVQQGADQSNCQEERYSLLGDQAM